MSQTHMPRSRKQRSLSSLTRKALTADCTQTRADARAEAMLRDMAFVLDATRRVREAITGDMAGPK